MDAGQPVQAHLAVLVAETLVFLALAALGFPPRGQVLDEETPMKSARHLVGRSLTWFGIGVAVFVGVLTTLPVPQAAEGPGEGVPEETFAIVDVTAFDGEAVPAGMGRVGRGREDPARRSEA